MDSCWHSIEFLHNDYTPFGFVLDDHAMLLRDGEASLAHATKRFHRLFPGTRFPERGALSERSDGIYLRVQRVLRFNVPGLLPT